LHEAPHPAFGHPLPTGEGKHCSFSLWEKVRMREIAAQISPQIDAARAEKDRFLMETK